MSQASPPLQQRAGPADRLVVEQPGLAINGTSARFPVRRIYCVGRNYRAHALEMGADPDREAPFFFMKPADAVRPSGATIAYPPRTQDLQHEVELVVAVGRAGSNLQVADALQLVFGYAVGLDLTRRDLQGAAKKAGQPWETGKCFDGSAPVGELLRRVEAHVAPEDTISLAVNGAECQRGTLGQMIWSVPEILVELSQLFELQPGDLVFTGTPDGVGPLRVGDSLEARAGRLPPLSVQIGPARDGQPR